MLPKIAIAIVLISMPLICNAAKPVKIQPLASGSVADGYEIKNFKVFCSDGRDHTIFSWPSQKKWCLQEASDSCWKKQIKTAKMACK